MKLHRFISAPSKFGVILFSVLSMLPLRSGTAQTLQPPTRLSTSPAGIGGNASSSQSALSPNGRYTVFRSSASNLVSSDTNFFPDIFLRDAVTSSITRVTTAIGGAEANGESNLPVISFTSPNGFFAVAYESTASNLGLFSSSVPDSNEKKDIYFSIPSNGITERASIGIGGSVADGDSREPSITILPQPESVLLAFTSDAKNLTANDTNNIPDVFLARITFPFSVQDYFVNKVSVIRVSEGNGGIQSNGVSDKPAISGDGRFIVFQSDATNLFTVTGVPTARQIYMYDISNRTTTLVSRTSTGVPGNGPSSSPSISFSGTYITYLTTATNIVVDGQSVPQGGTQIVRFNVATGVTERVNVNTSGGLSNGTTSASSSARISPDGRSVVFTDAGSNLSDGDTNGKFDTFLRDMEEKTTLRTSTSASGGIPDDSSFDAVSAGKAFTALSLNSVFTSFATNLVVGDTEGRTDVFNVGVTLNPQIISKSVQLETPPDLSIVSGRAFSVGMLPLRRPVAARASNKRVTTKVQFKVVATRVTGNRRDVRTKISSRNLVTFRNIPPGTYSVTYRAETVRNGKVISRTKFSPTQQVVL